jgi:hypothetical protein
MSLSSIAEYEAARTLKPFCTYQNTATILSTDSILTQAISQSPKVHAKVADCNIDLGMDVYLEFHHCIPFQNSP